MLKQESQHGRIIPIFIVVICLGSIYPWASFVPRATITRFLWSLQFSNAYSPFTKYENYNSDGYFKRQTLYKVLNKNGEEIASQAEAELFLKTKGPLMAQVPFRIMSIVLINNSSLKKQAEDLLHHVGCEKGHEFFNYSSAEIADSVVLEVVSKESIRKVTIKCGTI